MKSLDFNEEFNHLKNIEEEDTLLQSLLFLAKYYKREASTDSIIANIAISQSYMTPKIFQKAALNIGLKSKAISRKISDIEKKALPCVLFLKENKAVVLTQLNHKEKKAKTFAPHLGMGEVEFSYEELEEIYTKNLFLIGASYNFENRVNEEIKIEDNKKWFFSTLWKNIGIYKLVILAAILINIFVIFVPLFTMNVYDRVLPNKAIDTLWVLFIGISIVLVFDLILKLIRGYFIEVAAQRADTKMSSIIFEQILNIKLDSKPPSTGMFVSRLQSFESVREFFTSATIIAFVDLPFIFLFILIIYFIGETLAYISLATMLIAIIFSYLMQKPIKKTVLKSAKEDQIKQTVLTETVTGLEIIKSVRAANRMRVHWEKSVSQTTKYNNKTHYLSQIVAYSVNFIASFSSILIVAYGVILADQNEITMGAIIACMILNGRVLAPISQISNMITRLDRTIISLNNINEIMNMPVERENKIKYLSRPNLKGNIHYKEVFFSYKEQKFDVLKNINLKIQQGEKIGIIGRIGSGKSTLAKLLLNLYTPSKGSILIDNTNISQIDPIDLRKAVGYVPQEPFLFMGSIKDNIAIGHPYATDEEILHVSKISGVHDFLGKHERGYDLIVGERGEGLSGGERQSVTLARALLSKPNILLLDEPTNMMDELSENIFKQKIASIMENKTVIIITHKPSLLTLVNRLIVVDDGKIVADGEKNAVINALNRNSIQNKEKK